MKKILIFGLMLLCFQAVGQFKAPRGIYIGPRESPFVIKIDSVTYQDDILRFYNAGDNLLPEGSGTETDTIAITELCPMLEDSTVSYATPYELSTGLALKANISAPTFTTRINLSHTLTGNYLISNGGTHLAHYTGNTGYKNIAIGLDALDLSRGSHNNVAIGVYSMLIDTGGYYNTAVGNSTLTRLVSGYENTAIGYQAGKVATGNNSCYFGVNTGLLQTSGNANTYIGHSSGSGSVTGANNTYLGYYSGGSSAVVGSNNIFIGNQAGLYETGSNTLIVDALGRSSEANQRSSSLIYGVMNSTVSSQTMNINATTTINSVLTLTPRASAPGSPAEGMIYSNSSDHHLYFYNGTGWVQLDN